MKQDYAKAAELFYKACKLGNALACSNLGFAYEKGQGVEKDRKFAKGFYERGCKLGEFSACEYVKDFR